MERAERSPAEAPRRFLVRASSSDGLHVKATFYTGRGSEAKCGEATFSLDEWKAFHVILLAGANKYGPLLGAEVEVDCPEDLGS